MLSGNYQRAENTGRARARTIAIGIAAVGLLTVVQLLRVEGVPVYRTVWAEDGQVFLAGAVSGTSIFTTYAGYLHLVPRLLTLAGYQLPLEWMSFWFAAVPAFLTALLAVAIFRLSDFVVRSAWLRVVLALSFVLPPILVYETMAVTANLQWPLIAALFWALVRPTSARWDLAACIAVAAAAALTSSIAFLFLPLAVMVLVMRRHEWRARIVPIVFFVGCLVQLVAVLTTSDGASSGDSSVFALPRLYVVNVVGESFLGHVLVDRAWLDIGIGAFIVLAVAVSIAIVLLWLRCDTPGRLWGTIALVMSIGVYCALTFWRGVDLVELHDGVKTGSGARYTGLGLQLLVAAFVIFIDRAALRARVHQVLVVLVVAQAVLIPLTAFRLTTLRSDGPGWENQLAVSRAECEQQGTTESFVVITPSGWVVQIPCRDLR